MICSSQFAEFVFFPFVISLHSLCIWPVLCGRENNPHVKEFESSIVSSVVRKIMIILVKAIWERFLLKNLVRPFSSIL